MGCSVHAPELPTEQFTSHSAGFCSPIRPLFPEQGNGLLWLWRRGWGLVYLALSTVDGFTGYAHHCTWEEQYRLGKADHPEANLGPVFLGRLQFLLCAGADVCEVVLWNQPGDWSSLTLTGSERGKKVNFNLDTAQLLVLVFRKKMVRLIMSSHDWGLRLLL